jgi:hypothetical protein
MYDIVLRRAMELVSQDSCDTSTEVPDDDNNRLGTRLDLDTVAAASC